MIRRSTNNNPKSTKHSKEPEPIQKKPPPRDYLKELKSKREQDGVQVKRHHALLNEAEIDKVLKSRDMSEAEKYHLLRIKTDQLEQRAEQEERVLHVIGGSSGGGISGEREVERAIEVNDMYIESIKAKLKMLDQI